MPFDASPEFTPYVKTQAEKLLDVLGYEAENWCRFQMHSRDNQRHCLLGAIEVVSDKKTIIDHKQLLAAINDSRPYLSRLILPQIQSISHFNDRTVFRFTIVKVLARMHEIEMQERARVHELMIEISRLNKLASDQLALAS